MPEDDGDFIGQDLELGKEYISPLATKFQDGKVRKTRTKRLLKHSAQLAADNCKADITFLNFCILPYWVTKMDRRAFPKSSSLIASSGEYLANYEWTNKNNKHQQQQQHHQQK